MHRYLPAAIAVSLLTVACQGGSRSPMSPASNAPNDTPPVPSTLATITGGGSGWEARSEVGWLHTLTISGSTAETLQATLEPLRTAEAKGDAYQIDGTGFFTNSPCKDCLEVTGLRFDGDGDVLVSIQLTHPFALPTPPYTSASRLDLHAFDVMGFILTDPETAPLSFGAGRTVAPQVLTNADGYTDLYDGAIEPYYPTPDVREHPYRVFFRDDQAGNFNGTFVNGFGDLTNPLGHNTMAMGESDTVDFEFDLEPGAEELKVGLAIGLAWGQGAQGRGSNLGQRLSPIYYLPEFHHKAPWTVTASLLSNDLEGGNTGSSANLEVRLRDWQEGAVVSGAFAFAETPPDQTAAASEVASLSVSVPGLLLNPLTLDPQAPQSGTGLYDDAVWSTLITNQLGAPEGTYYAWIEAVDQRQPTATSGLNRAIEFFQPSDYHTGFLLPIEVGDVGNTPPDADLQPNPALGAVGKPLQFDASTSVDAETPLAGLQFEFDFDLTGGNPANFVPDTLISSIPTASYVYCPVGAYTAAVRVTDPGGLTDIAITPVTISSFRPGTPATVLPAGTFSFQNIDSSFFSGEDRLAIAGNNVYALVYDDAAQVDSDYKHRLYVSTDGGGSWSAGAVLDHTYLPAQPSTYVWGDAFLVASPDGTVYVMAQQARPDFGNTRLSVWTSSSNGMDPWVERYVDPVGQKYSLCGAVDPNNPAHVILSYSTGTCNFRTVQTSTGQIGLALGGGLPGFCDGGFGASLFFAPNNRVYHCSVRFGTGSDGGMWMRRSDDNGSSWPPANHFLKDTGVGISTVFAHGRGMANWDDPTGLSMAYACRFNNNSSIGVCLFKTTDGGPLISFQQNIAGASATVESAGARYYPGGELMVYWTNTGGGVSGVTSCDNGASFSTIEPISPVGQKIGYVVDKPGTADWGCLYQASGTNGQISYLNF